MTQPSSTDTLLPEVLRQQTRRDWHSRIIAVLALAIAALILDRVWPRAPAQVWRLRDDCGRETIVRAGEIELRTPSTHVRLKADTDAVALRLASAGVGQIELEVLGTRYHPERVRLQILGPSDAVGARNEAELSMDGPTFSLWRNYRGQGRSVTLSPDDTPPTDASPPTDEQRAGDAQ